VTRRTSVARGTPPPADDRDAMTTRALYRQYSAVVRHLLDNPIWEALHSHHAHIARRDGGAARYVSQVAPFAAVDDADSRSAAALAGLIDADEHLDGPFLHVSFANKRAKALYDRLGFVERSAIPYWLVRRSTAAHTGRQ
jgi:hypothetical protein